MTKDELNYRNAKSCRSCEYHKHIQSYGDPWICLYVDKEDNSIGENYVCDAWKESEISKVIRTAVC